MSRRRHMAFASGVGRGGISGGWLLAAAVCVGALAVVAALLISEPSPVFSTTTTAFALPMTKATGDASLTAQVRTDLPALENPWGVGAGPTTNVLYVPPPEGLESRNRLPVEVRGVTADRVLDSSCQGQPCIVAVRMSKDDLRGLAYTTFAPR